MRSSFRPARWVVSCLAAVGLAAVGPVAQAKPKVEPTAHPLLWRITATDPGAKPSWLYGTIHLPDARVTTLPEAVLHALDGSDVLLTEIELDAKSQRAAQKASLLPSDSKLEDVVPAELYARLQKYVEARRFPLEGLARMKPWVVMTMLPMLDDLKTMLSGQALDARLVAEAKERDKETGALETLDEQLGVFEGFTYGEQAEMLDGTLALLEKAAADGRKPLEEMVQVYLSGDLDALAKLMDEMSGLGDHKELEERLEKVILIDRNRAMAERLAKRLRAEPKRSLFVAVGALHHTGDEGVVELLRKQGFELTRMCAPPAAEAKPPAEPEPVGARKQAVGSGR